MIHNNRSRSVSFFLISLSLLAALLACVSNASAQKITFSSEERKVIELEDHRAPARAIVQYLSSPEERVAWRAAVALGNVADTSARSTLVERIRIEDRANVRDAIGWALGMLGADSANAAVMNTLMAVGVKHPSRLLSEALGRVVTPASLGFAIKYLSKSLDRHELTPELAAETMVRLSLHRLSSNESLALNDQLAMSEDPEAKWRAAFVYSRTDDSMRLGQRFDGIIQLTRDQSSNFIRMFASAALGRIHNPAAAAALRRVVRSEKDWRVQAMAIQAMQRLPTLDSVTLATIEPVVEASVATDKESEHTALASLEVIEHGIAMGKVKTYSDSLALQDWLHGFAARFEKYPEMSLLVKSATMPSMTRLGASDIYDELGDFNGAKDPFIRMNGTRAVETMEDTTIFRELLETMSLLGSYDQFLRLEALDSLWNRAKRHPAFMHQLEAAHFTNIYRYLVIRVGDLVEDPTIQMLSLQMMEDSAVVVDSVFRRETSTYLVKYLKHFQDARDHDQLLETIDLAKWLHDPSPEITTQLKNIYNKSVAEGWVDVGDSAKLALSVLGVPVTSLPKVVAKYAPIDWGLLESSPDTLLINMEQGQVYLRLLKEDAPLTVLNMIKLSQIGYFARSVYHRVVPAFVVQSGDPSQTGWGGPGYAIRTEVSPQDYDEPGIVGMASSGKDTEGSQWFITHVPTPHLDGHYTVWAKVVRGMELIDGVQLGDKIENIVLLKH